MELWIVWLALFLLLLVIEVLVVDLLFVMFAGGALAATIAALAGAPLIIQVAVFGVVSVLLLVAIRPWALRTFKKPTRNSATNVHALIGLEAVVVLPVSANGGRVKIGGDVWTARLDGAGTMPDGAKVTVSAIEGATAVVVPRHDGVTANPADPYGTVEA